MNAPPLVNVQPVASTSNPGLVSRLLLLFWRQRLHIVPVPAQPNGQGVAVGATQAPLLQVEGPRAPAAVHVAAPQFVPEG